MNRFIVLIILIVFSACNKPEKKKTGVNNPDNLSVTHPRKGRYQRHKRGMNRAAEMNNVFISGDTVYIPEGSPVSSKLIIQSVNVQDHLIQLTTTGVVKPLSGHKAEIATPFEGRLTKSHIKLGQKVSTGTPLFEVSSSDYLEAVRFYFQSRREREMAERNYLRKKDLLDAGVSSKKEFDEAKLGFDLADKEFEKANAIIKIYNLNPEEADLGKPLIVRSPISGEIVKSDITVGQYLKSDSEPVVIIADLNNVWIIANIKEKDLGNISLKDQVEVYTESFPDKPIKGHVSYLGNIMNEQTRSVEVYIECKNPEKILKCGMFVTVRFYHKLDNAIIVPASAVLQDFDKCYLFVEAGPGTYVKREVSVTSLPEKRLIIHSGLQEGNLFVSEGSIYLR